MAVNQIVVCTDFSDHAEVAFQTALDLTQRYHAKLYVVHVLPPVINPMLTDTDMILPEHPDENLVVSLNERMQEVYGNRIPEAVDGGGRLRPQRHGAGSVRQRSQAHFPQGAMLGDDRPEQKGLMHPIHGD
ncbi:MAG: universal stress protein [Desulfosarcina sp.]|nr:universal stress protein [Desulfosarcina sp.]